MTDPWYIPTLQLVTHLPLLASIAASYKLRKKIVYVGLPFILQIYILFWSSAYHICATVDVCALNAPLYSLQAIDNIFAFGGIVIILIMLVSTGFLYETISSDSIFWTLVVSFTPFGFIVVIVNTSLTGPGLAVGAEKALLIISMTIYIAFLKFLYVDKGRTLLIAKFDDPLVILALLLTLLGIGGFLVEITGYEWITHAFWHYFIFTALTLWQLTLVGHLPNMTDSLKKGAYTVVYDA